MSQFFPSLRNKLLQSFLNLTQRTQRSINKILHRVLCVSAVNFFCPISSFRPDNFGLIHFSPNKNQSSPMRWESGRTTPTERSTLLSTLQNSRWTVKRIPTRLKASVPSQTGLVSTASPLSSCLHTTSFARSVIQI